METDKSKNDGEKGQVPGEKSAKRRKKSRAFEKFEAANDEPQGTAVLAAVKQEHPEFSRSSSEDGDEAASREGNQQAAQSRAEAERRVRAELQARLKEEEKTLAPPAKVPVVVPARIHVPAFATSAGLGQNAALLALPTRRAEGERKARLELQEKLKAESKTLLEERAKAEKAKAAEVAKSKAKAEAKEAKEAKEPKEPKASASKVEEAKAKSKVDAKAAKTKEAKAAEAKSKVAPKAAAGARKSQAAHPPEDGQLVPVKQEHGRSRSSSADGQSKGKKPTKASAAKAKASPNAPAGGHLFGAAAMKPKAQEKSSGADSMVLVEIVFKEKILKVNHKASTKIQELFNLYEPRIRGKCKDLGALRVCDDKGVEQGSELTLSVLRESGVRPATGATGASNPAVRLVFQEDDWLS